MKIPKKIFGLPILLVIAGAVILFLILKQKKAGSSKVVANAETVIVPHPRAGALTKSKMAQAKMIPNTLAN